MHLLAAGDNPVSVQLMPLITTLVVFGVAFWVLKSQVWPRITKGLDERERKILDEIAAAEEVRRKADAAQSEFEQSLAAARQEASEMIAKAKADAKAAGEELKRRNEAELVEMKQRASREIEAAKHAAIGELHAEASSLAADIAGKILRREISAADQQALVDESLEQLGALQQN